MSTNYTIYLNHPSTETQIEATCLGIKSNSRETAIICRTKAPQDPADNASGYFQISNIKYTFTRSTTSVSSESEDGSYIFTISVPASKMKSESVAPLETPS